MFLDDPKVVHVESPIVGVTDAMHFYVDALEAWANVSCSIANISAACL
jgi:hypothetical protein